MLQGNAFISKYAEELKATANTMCAPGKGLLAAGKFFRYVPPPSNPWWRIVASLRVHIESWRGIPLPFMYPSPFAAAVDLYPETVVLVATR